MKKRNLPPKAFEKKDGRVCWKRIEEIDFDALGFFLSCHLVLEHYLDNFLDAQDDTFDWESARLTFTQKVNLLSKLELKEPYRFIPALKHLNGLRNKISHDIDFRPTSQDMVPLAQLVRNVCLNNRPSSMPDLDNPQEILENFASAVYAWMAGAITVAEKLKQRKKLRL